MIPDDLEQAPQWLDQLANEGVAQLAKIEPLDRNEIEQLHFHAPRMVKLLNLMVRAKEVNDDDSKGDIAVAIVAVMLAELADPKFHRHLHALFTKLAAREFTLIPRETT